MSERGTGDDERAGDPRNDPEGDPEEAAASLRAAAHQVITAARGLLDAAEVVIDDPRLVRDALGTLGTLAEEAARMATDARRRTGPSASAGADEGGGRAHGEDDGGVQKIPLD